jgi:pimeloyl-ACP methyl ester carboxylesterase
MAALALLAGCGDKTAPPAAAPPVAASGWVHQDPAHRAEIALVFVHGVFGDARGTWTNDNGRTFFDLIHQHPKIGKPVDIYAFGFPSNKVRSGSFSISDASKSLFDKLEYHELNKYPTVIFVAHSMGGLVVMRTLLDYPEYRQRAPLVVLYATPQEGAQISTLAAAVSDNGGLEQMLPADRNGYLQLLDTQWKLQDKKARPAVVCAFEKKPMASVMIVPWSSATRFCDGPGTPVSENHLGIVKPDGPDHDSVIVLVNALNANATGPQFAANLSMPDFVPQGEDYMFPLANPFGEQAARLVNSGRKAASFTFEQISPGLHVWPNTPAVIDGGASIDLKFGLGWGATALEYGFVLNSDAIGRKKVVVKVTNAEAMRLQQTKLENLALNNVNEMLSAPKPRPNWGSAEDMAKANDDIVANVRDTVRKSHPQLPEEAQWTIAAEVMNAIKLPKLALVALDKSTAVSPSGAATPGFKRLSAAANAQIRAPASAPAIRNPVSARLDPDTTVVSTQTAKLLKTYPGLASMGARLELSTLAEMDKTPVIRPAPPNPSGAGRTAVVRPAREAMIVRDPPSR